MASGAVRMKTLVSIIRRACISGSLASITSTAALAVAGSRDCRSTFAPVNAISHWVWNDKAVRQNKPSLRYTATGYVIHHLAAIFWALFFEAAAPHGRKRRGPEVIADATAVTALAATVDLKCTPERLTPGFERRVGAPALTGAYVAFGIGLALYAWSQRSR